MKKKKVKIKTERKKMDQKEWKEYEKMSKKG